MTSTALFHGALRTELSIWQLRSFFLPEKCALHPQGLTGQRKEVCTLVKRRDLGSELPSGPVGASWEVFGADGEESVHPLVALMRDKSLS